MASPFTVALPGGGQIVVNASDAQAAAENAQQQTPDLNWSSGGGGQVTSGGSGGTTNAVGQVGGTPGGTGSVATPGGTVSGASSGAIDAYLQAVASGNVAAANEAIRQFNVGHQLDQDKFNQAVLQYNQDHGLAVNLQAANIAAQQAGLTGFYTAPGTSATPAAPQGVQVAPGWTTGANAGAAGAWNGAPDAAGYSVRNGMIVNAQGASTGVPAPAGLPEGTQGASIGALANAVQGAAAPGPAAAAGGAVPTLAQQTLSGVMANGQPTEAARQFNTTAGLSALTLASNLQPNAFRQAQALYGLGQGGYTPLMQSAAGAGPRVTSFQAPTLSAADTASLNFLSNQTGTGSYTANQSQHWMDSLPAPNAVNWSALSQAGPGATDLVTKGLAAKWGIDEASIKNIQAQAMPGFQAPTLAGTYKG